MMQAVLYLVPAIVGSALVAFAVRYLPLRGKRRLIFLSIGIGFFAAPMIAGGHGITAISLAALICLLALAGLVPSLGEVTLLLGSWVATTLTVGLVLYFRYPDFSMLENVNRDAA